MGSAQASRQLFADDDFFEACTRLLCQRMGRMHPINLTYFMWTYARAGRNNPQTATPRGKLGYMICRLCSGHRTVIVDGCVVHSIPGSSGLGLDTILDLNKGIVAGSSPGRSHSLGLDRPRPLATFKGNLTPAGIRHEELLKSVADHFCKGWLPTMDRCSLGDWGRWEGGFPLSPGSWQVGGPASATVGLWARAELKAG